MTVRVPALWRQRGREVKPVDANPPISKCRCPGVAPITSACYPSQNANKVDVAKYLILLERAKGFEPSTPTLARFR